MTVTIEVANEAGGMGVVKRTLLHSGNFTTPHELEAAAVSFIRDSSAANKEELDGYAPTGKVP
jgi:hypothetical protein